VLSTSHEEDEIIASYTLGVISFVHKPVKFIDFADAIRMLGLFLMVTNQQPASLSQ
jgi:DNA-binding NarL/FixJ family response regulator